MFTSINLDKEERKLKRKLKKYLKRITKKHGFKKGHLKLELRLEVSDMGSGTKNELDHLSGNLDKLMCEMFTPGNFRDANIGTSHFAIQAIEKCEWHDNLTENSAGLKELNKLDFKTSTMGDFMQAYNRLAYPTLLRAPNFSQASALKIKNFLKFYKYL